MKLKQRFAGKFRRVILFLFDCYIFGMVACAYYISVGLFKVDTQQDAGKIFINAAIILAGILLARLIFGVYNSVWRYTRTFSYLKMIIADIIGGAAAALISRLSGNYEGIWFFIIIAAVNALAALFSRFTYRLIYKIKNNVAESESDHIGVAIVGAGQLGAYLANELLYNPDSKYKPLFFIDKDPGKLGNRIAGLKIFPEDDRIFETIEKLREYEIVYDLDL